MHALEEVFALTMPRDMGYDFLGMSFQDPEVRTFMEMEGLKSWLPARTTGYAQLEKAVGRFNFYGGTASAAI